MILPGVPYFDRPRCEIDDIGPLAETLVIYEVGSIEYVISASLDLFEKIAIVGDLVEIRPRPCFEATLQIGGP